MLGTALDVGLSLAANAASADARWPVGDVIRRHPWPAIPVLAVLVLVFGIAAGTRGANDETKSGADTANQVTASKLSTVAGTATVTVADAATVTSVGRDLHQITEVHNYYYREATPGEPEKPTSEDPATSAPAGSRKSGQNRLPRAAGIWLSLAVGVVVLMAIPVVVPKLWSPHAPKAADPFARTSHSPSRHSPTPAPSTPVHTSASATPAAPPVSGDMPIYQDKEVTIGSEDVDVDTFQFLLDPRLGVRVKQGHTGLSLEPSGHNQGMRLVIYSARSRPTRGACITLLNQVTVNDNGMYTSDSAVGQYVCLRTAEQNIAVIQFKNIGVGDFGPITADITLYGDLFAPLANSTRKPPLYRRDPLGDRFPGDKPRFVRKVYVTTTVTSLVVRTPSLTQQYDYYLGVSVLLPPSGDRPSAGPRRSGHAAGLRFPARPVGGEPAPCRGTGYDVRDL